MLRWFDFECVKCGKQRPEFVEVPHGDEAPRRVILECCAGATPHRRIMSRPARYVYDRPMMREVYGGSYDTMGHRSLTRLPELPEGATADQAMALFQTSDYQEIRKKRRHEVEMNKAKAARAEAAKAGANMDLRNTPLPGDPPRPMNGTPTPRGENKTLRLIFH